MSTLTIAGNLTRDPELRSVNGGRSVVSFSIAENRRWADKDSGATQEAVTYLDVTAWGAMAEHVATSLRTGDRPWSPAAWSSAPGRALTELATPSTSSSPPRSQPACATPRPPSPGRPGPPPARTTTELSISTEPRRAVVLAAPGAGPRNRLPSTRGRQIGLRSPPEGDRYHDAHAVGPAPLAGWPDDGCDR